MRYLFRVASLGVAIALVQQAAAQDAEVPAKLDEALRAASSFEMGGDSGPLKEIEGIVFQLPADSKLRGPIEEKLIAALDSAATHDAKRFLCRQLRVIGTERCVAPLARLLADPELAHVARYALGRLESPAAGETLLAALGETSGDVQAGIIATLGDRNCAAARGRLVELLEASDAIVAAAAAVALGQLGDADSAAALQRARSGASAALRLEIDNALLNAAEQLAENGNADQAAAIFQKFYPSGDSRQLRFAGLRGLVAVQKDRAAELLAGAIGHDDAALRRYAISLVELVPGREATEAFIAAADALPTHDKALLLRALGNRGDASASGALARAAGDDDAAVRLAALEALGKVGDASVVATLARAAAAAPDDMERNVARAALRSLSADEADRVLIQSLQGADAPIRAELIHALAARRVAAAVDPLLALATDPAPSVRRAAIEAFGALADGRHLAALAELAATVQPGEDAEALVEAAGRAFVRADDPTRCADVVLAEMDRAPAASRPTLVRLLGKTGARKALEALRGFVDDGPPEVRQAAVLALTEWPDASAGPDLLALLTDPAHADRKQAVLAGYLRLAALSEDPGAMYLAALAHVEEVDGKKAILEGLGLTADSRQALDVALRCLDDPALGAAAGVAALRIAFRLRRTDEPRARKAVERVLAEVDHPDVQKRGREVLGEFDKYDDHILQWVTVGPFQEQGQDGAAIYRTVFPPETDPDAVDWQPLTKGVGSWNVNLEATYGGLDFVAAYLRTRVWSEVEQEVQLEMGSDDGVKAWLNGELLYDRWGEGSISPREKRVKARLRNGWNDLMLKVVDQQGGWMGACRIRKPDGSALSGLKIEAR